MIHSMYILVFLLFKKRNFQINHHETNIGNIWNFELILYEKGINKNQNFHEYVISLFNSTYE